MSLSRPERRLTPRPFSNASAMARSLVQCILVGCLILVGCKARVSPHVTPEGDADLTVAESVSNASPTSSGAYASAGSSKTVLTLNNAPGPTEPLEQDLLQQEVSAFEHDNPNVQIDSSTWEFTPESFYDRAKNHTLTDIVEVSMAQLSPIIDLNYAADITDLVAAAPEMKRVNPEVMKLFTRNGRVYGVPLELHTMALFYNRRLVDEVLHPKPVDTKPKTKSGKKSSPEKSKGKGADALPREYLEEQKPELQLAQFFRRRTPSTNYYNRYYGQQEQRPAQSERGEQAVQEYYNLSPDQQQGGRRQAPTAPGRDGSYYDYSPRSARPESPSSSQEEATSEQSGEKSSQDNPQSAQPSSSQEEGSGEIESAKPTRKSRRSSSHEESRSLIDEDVITTGDETTTTPSAEVSVTTSVRTAGLPQDWDSLIRVAAKLTDHTLGVYGYAPVLFAKEGGREFSQWAVQSGLDIEVPTANSATLDVNTSTAAEVAQFLKELHWRFDVTPPIDRCYSDNLMRMFAEGKIAMMALPATRETFQQLVKLGMPLDDIGVAPLPQGPKSRNHLTFGRCLIVNSQLDREHRLAAFKWLMFQMNPDRVRNREQYHFREQDITGIPRVPIFSKSVQRELNDSLKHSRTLPIFLDYEEMIASHLRPEPPFFTDRLYEAIAQGVRPIIEQEDSKPMQAIANVGAEFEAKYLLNAPTRQGVERYLKLLTGR